MDRLLPCSLLPGPAQVGPVCFILFASHKKRTKQPQLVMVLLLLGVRMSPAHLALIPGNTDFPFTTSKGTTSSKRWENREEGLECE